MRRSVSFYMLLIAISIILLFILNLVLGTISIPVKSIWNILFVQADENEIWHNIVWKSRMPQALISLVAGAGLSISGLQMQTIFRNPLAEPYLFGSAGGAA